MFKCLAVKTSLIALACSAALGAALADAPRQIDVPPGDLIGALEAIAREGDIQLAFQPEQLRGLRTQGVSGVLTVEAAIRKLLEGTNLQLRTDESSGAMMIAAPELRAPVRDGRTSQQMPLGFEPIAEVIVTAQKREERLLDVPAPVTVLSATRLVETNQVQLQDFYA